MIDRLREQIQQRLDQLAGEAERLREALAVLDPRSSAKATRNAPTRGAGTRKRARAASAKPQAPATRPAPVSRTATAAPPSPPRAARGATKASVLAALDDGEAMTAGQVAEKTGLARGTVSTTLSKLAHTGEVQKAERGYRLVRAGEPAAASPPVGGQQSRNAQRAAVVPEP